MARVLFVVPPLAGHVNPTVAVGEALAARGHEPTWTGHPDVVPGLLAPGAAFVPIDEAVPAGVIAAVAERSSGLRGPAALRFLWRDLLVPLARTMLPGVERAVAAVRPDALVVDQQALAGAAVAARDRLPWATSATTSAELTDPLAAMGKVGAWVRGLMTEVLVSAGLDAAEAAALDPRFSPDLVLAFTTGALVGPVDRFPGHYAFVGPSLAGRPDATPFPWEWLEAGTPLVLVSLGTLNGHEGARFFGEAVAALRELPVQAVVVAPPDLVPGPPANVLVRPRVPQLTLLAHAAAVVSHGGHNTVCEALANGLPLVVAPIRDDQPIVAQQVVDAGAGVRVRFGRVGADGLRAALAAVLEDRRYRVAAARVQESFARAGGAAAAARRIEGALLAPTRAGLAWS
jgi:MGT family glycosyltransferase